MKISEFIKIYQEEIGEYNLNLLTFSFFNKKISNDYILTEEEKTTLISKIKELKSGRPIQYVIGNVDFYGNIINVDENVLIPRFETEGLVEETVNISKTMFDKKVRILDIGTGSGCIAITLKNMLNSDVDAVDISSSAIKIAKKNAHLNKVDVNFILSDLFKNVKEKYDIIISNPPYIANDEEIEDIVKNNEPHLALYAKDNGLFYYKEIIKQANNYLNEISLIVFEIGYKQGDILKEYAKSYFPNSRIYVKKDLSDKDRYLFIMNE